MFKVSSMILTIAEFILYVHMIIFSPCRIISHDVLMFTKDCVGIHFVQSVSPKNTSTKLKRCSSLYTFLTTSNEHNQQRHIKSNTLKNRLLNIKYHANRILMDNCYDNMYMYDQPSMMGFLVVRVVQVHVLRNNFTKLYSN